MPCPRQSPRLAAPPVAVPGLLRQYVVAPDSVRAGLTGRGRLARAGLLLHFGRLEGTCIAKWTARCLQEGLRVHSATQDASCPPAPWSEVLSRVRRGHGARYCPWSAGAMARGPLNYSRRRPGRPFGGPGAIHVGSPPRRRSAPSVAPPRISLYSLPGLSLTCSFLRFQLQNVKSCMLSLN